MTVNLVQVSSPRSGAIPSGILDSLNRLIAALREELQQYGELLALLDQQLDLASVSLANELLPSIAMIQSQMAVIERVRSDRDNCHHAVAAALGQSPAIPFTALIPLLPADYRPLVEALVQENNELLLRVRQRAHWNHALMSRSAALMRQFMSALPTRRESDTAPPRHPASLPAASPMEDSV